jgi:hypothetical protein
MEEAEMIQLWKSYNKKLEESLVLNRKNAEDITRIKVKSLLGSMKPLKIFTILAGMVWVGLGSMILVNLFMHAFDSISKFFLFSAAIQVLLTAIALVLYIYQLVLIQQVDISQPVVETQQHLARLKSSTLWIARILFLQLPVWTTFYLGSYMLEKGNIVFYIIQSVVTLLFAYAAVWLFFNIKYENRHKKWFRLIFNGKEWSPLMRSMELLRQAGEYNTGNITAGENP